MISIGFMKAKRIWIIGANGSGKTTLAKKLSKKLKIKSYNLDDIYWARKWNKARDEKSIEKRLIKIVDKKSWIIEGVFSSWIERGIRKADLVILLDLPMPIILWRLFLRHLKRGEDNLPQTWKSLLGMMRFSTGYKRKNARFLRHKELIGKHNLKFIVAKNKKQVEDLIGGLT